jgi:hypothetical protein
MNSLQTVSFTSALQKLIEFLIPKLSVVFILLVLPIVLFATSLFTRIQSDQRSSLDYALISSNLKNCVSSVFIDEEGKLDLYNDHVIVRIVLKPSVYIKPNELDL